MQKYWWPGTILRISKISSFFVWSVPELIKNVRFRLDPCWFISTTVPKPRLLQHHFVVLFLSRKSLSWHYSMRSAELSPTCLWFLHTVAFVQQCHVCLDTGECSGHFEIEATNSICQWRPLTTCPRFGFTEHNRRHGLLPAGLETTQFLWNPLILYPLIL